MKQFPLIYRWIISLTVISFMCPIANAQWSTNPVVNNAICTAGYDQERPAMIPDGAGGAIITWADNRSGNYFVGNYDIYAQRINVLGQVLWQIDGVPICTSVNSQHNPSIVSDGSGGAIITWTDDRNGLADIYAQRINNAGIVQWAVNGVPICAAPNTQGALDFVTDGVGGAIVTWRDNRIYPPDEGIYVQRVDSTGMVQWTTNGVVVCNSNGFKEQPRITSDGVGGAIISWPDSRNGTGDWNVYAQRVDYNGTMQWTNNGISVCSYSENQYGQVITTDGAGGAILAWHDYRAYNSVDIYAQKIDAFGLSQWAQGGVPVCTESYDQLVPKITYSGAGGAIIAWWDKRGNLGYYDVYCQKLNGNGSIAWTNGGIPVCTANGSQNSSQIVNDGTGGAIITWQDDRGSPIDVYAQRIDSLGNAMWVNNGIPVSATINNQYVPVITSTINNGAIIVWQDDRNGSLDIYAQKINANGTLHCTTPQSTVSMIKCSDELPYAWNGLNLNSSGTYTFTTVNSEGCDSSSILYLSVNYTTSTNLSASYCQSYTWNGQTYTSSGVYTNTFINSNGCIQTDSLVLTIYPSPTITPISNQVFCSQQQTQPIALSGSPNGVSFDITGGTARGLPNQFGVTSIPSFTALNGTSIVTITPKANGCTGTPSTFTLSVANCPPVTLNLKFYIQGYYQDSGMMRPVLYNQAESIDPNSTVVDNVIVELHSASPPYAMVKTTIGTLNQNGTLSCSFSGSVTNTPFYIVIHHRNSIVTWSATPVTMLPNVTYDFTTMNSQSFGSNQVDISSNGASWAFYNGDVNQDDNIDLLDAAEIEGGINNFAYGFYTTDLNGDGNVDLLDLPILELNINHFIFSTHP